MDSQTLKRLGKITERLYMCRISFYIEFFKSEIRLRNESYEIRLIYRKYRSLDTPSYQVYDICNSDMFNFSDFRLLMKHINEIFDYEEQGLI